MLAEFDFLILPHVNAALNLLATLLILSGLVAVKMGRVDLHRPLMLAATTVSALFLCSYLTYHLNAPPVKFTREGWIRPVYFTILISHIVLAVMLVPLLLATVWLGLRDRRELHRRWARVTAPIWLYVSVTGVLVYKLLYG